VLVEIKVAGVCHTDYEEFPGGHSRAYWAEHFKDSLRFFAGVLNTP
jgi:enterochelin esterase-like enzyme